MRDYTCMCGEEFKASVEEEGAMCPDCIESIESISLELGLILAICKEFNCSPQDITQSNYSESDLEIDGESYEMYCESDADDLVAERIKDLLWTFNADFLASETGFSESIFMAIQSNGKCESNNEAVLALIESSNTSFSDFVTSAISADGRGHFLSSYDGEETEILYNNELYFFYRQ